ncbi:class I SAM-dependent methyltransferase [Betaproteobacteria bacterium PRO7]|jgi:SAM-dependent methyltransferase|nr:class I SAM-dependent methyltransferase [Burkholderiaceae bacterium]MDL1863402.1 class I SAM-dependent methyltransferase [Betaproteobacteria bacterium PRO7]
MNDGFANPRATWDARFAREDYIFGLAPNVFLTQQAHRLAAGMRALCVADGEGRNSVWLAQRGLEVVAFDIAPLGVAKARRFAEGCGVRVDYRVASVEEWDWTPEAFDVVAAIFVQFAAPAVRAKMFEGMLETLTPGGWLLLQGYTPRQLGYRTGGPPCAEHLYTPELLRAAFGAHDIVELREHDDVLAEGTQHAGMSALIDCVVRKRG